MSEKRPPEDNDSHISEDLKNQVERLWDMTRDAFEKGGREVMRLSRIGRVKLETTQLQRERQRLFAELGERSYRLLVEGSLTHGELAPLAKSIEALNAKIADECNRMSQMAHTEAQAAAAPAGAASTQAKTQKKSTSKKKSSKRTSKKATKKRSTKS